MNGKNTDNLGEWQEKIVTVTQARRKGFMTTNPEKAEWGVRLRIRMIWMSVIIMIAGITARLLYLQVLESEQKLLLAKNNHIEQIREVAMRGSILDSRGEILAQDVDDKRVYPYGKITSAIIGYTSFVNESEVGCIKGVCYEPSMKIGRIGIEQIAEYKLKGKDGGVIQEIDAGMNVIRERGKNNSQRGGDVDLTIDLRLQREMYLALEKVSGAGVALDMQGRVLGLVSTPTYDPNEILKYLQDTTHPYFLNKATHGMYPPGSVFKMVTAYAGLSEGTINAETKIEDTGEIRVGEYRYGNWYFDQYGRKEGEVDLARALARSNDIYFYKVGESIGINKLVASAKQFGYGAKTGIELGEETGLVPDPIWKERRTGENWFLGNTYHLSIGQGDLLATPIQVARATLGAVTGRLCRLSILKNNQIECDDLKLKNENVDLVREGMRQACANGGVAFPFFDFEPYVLCKTGTAQHSGQREKNDLPHAWITVAYPGENPELILTIFVESGGEGSAVAAPIAKKILEEWKNLNHE